MPVCLRSAASRLRRVQASSSVDCRREPGSRVSPPRLRAIQIVLDLRHGPRTLPSLYRGRAEGRGLETPGALNQVRTKPPDRWDNADRNPAPAPQSKPSNPCLPPRGAERAVGGIRAWAENSGHRASHLPTVLRFRRLWAPIPKFVATAMNESSTEAMLDQPNWSVTRLEKEYCQMWAVIGRCCSILSRRPPAGKTCLSLTSRAVSSKATETPFTSRTRPNLWGSW